jgi:hypothetical protein
MQQNVARLFWEPRDSKTVKTNVGKIHTPLSDLVNNADACPTQYIRISRQNTFVTIVVNQYVWKTCFLTAIKVSVVEKILSEDIVSVAMK